MNTEKITTTITICTIIIIITLLGLQANKSSKKKKEMLEQRVVADVIMIEKTDKHRYSIIMDGYEIQTWTKGNICVKIDPRTTTIKAEFTPDGAGHYYGTPVTLTFANKEKVRKMLGEGYTGVTGNNNVVVQSKNNIKGGCFISTIF